MSAYNFEEDPTYVEYMKDGIIDSTIEKTCYHTKAVPEGNRRIK